MPPYQRAETIWSSEDFLHALRARGATGVRRVSFRRNRSTAWSLTQRGTVLNLHTAYRHAPDHLLDAFARIAREGGVASAESEAASNTVLDWPGLREAISTVRSETAEARAHTACCGTRGQKAYVAALYAYLNATRFEGRLPESIPVRLSNRMRSALGHMLPGESRERGRYVAEIALNVDLMLEGNGPERVDTLLHEMAHAIDYLESGHRGHGSSWKAWARRVGCRPTTLYDRPVQFRDVEHDTVRRVPPLPPSVSRRFSRR